MIETVDTMRAKVAEMMGPCPVCNKPPDLNWSEDEYREAIDASRHLSERMPGVAAIVDRLQYICAECYDARYNAAQRRKARADLRALERNVYLNNHLPENAKGRTFAHVDVERWDANAAVWDRLRAFADDQNKNVWLWGGASCGKTWAAHCVANAMLAKGRRPLEKFAREVNEMGAWNYKGKALALLCRSDLLIVQDVDRVNWTDDGLNILAEILERRRPRRTLFTCGVDLDGMMRQWRNSETLRDSVWSRIRPLDELRMNNPEVPVASTEKQVRFDDDLI